MINSTNSEFQATHENELAYVLSKFNSDFIYNIVNESLANKLRVYSYEAPNIINAFEQNFNITTNDYPDGINQIVSTRNDTYVNIIKLLCDNYQLVINVDDGVDLFLIASSLYSLLVSSFQKSVVAFFVNYINSEKVPIYEMLQLSTRKKNKDSSSLYSKRVFKDQVLGVISANLEFVVSSICTGFDITLDTYLKYVFEETPEIYNLLTNILAPTNDFFRTYIGSTFRSEFGPVLLTAIRLELHKSLISNSYEEITEGGLFDGC